MANNINTNNFMFHSSGENGGIVLSSNTKSLRFKKPLLIATAGFLIIIFVVIIVAAAMNRPSDVTDFSESRNTFVNFCLFGEPKADPLAAEYESTHSYSIERATENHDEAFFNRAKEYYNTFVATVAESKDISSYTEIFDFLYLYATTNILSEQDIVDMFVERGADAAYQTIKNTYVELVKTPYAPGAEYASAKQTSDFATVDQLTIYNASGCIKDGNIESDCRPDLTGRDTSRIQEAANLRLLVSTRPLGIATEFVEYLFDLADEEIQPR